ncbi:MAG TPA: HAD family hydrolase [Thiolapillus brandeum]|uniref:Histidinol-phosphatase n=1 Tax=Thiolapillus brandeum TaxID=1076588 RepID=A0A7C5N0C5_9GAMM|nr:HAD family hydrolase [Thiolapillus brandeum]
MALALFDLDNTLLAGDSDYLWGVFLSEKGVVDRDTYERENERFYEEYKEGRLDIMEFLTFSLRPLAENDPAQLHAWREEFLREKIDPILTEDARLLVEMHRKRGDTLAVITATNAFVTAPIVERFGVPNLIATEPEMAEGRYTGRVRGIPCFREGKVKRLKAWLAGRDESLENAWFYSDSHNDLPLLELVSHPMPVDPDPALETVAAEKGWPVLYLHKDAPPP